MSVRSLITPILLTPLLVALGSCELGPPEDTTDQNKPIVDEAVACGETPPDCLTACGGEPNGTVAACVDGDWRCSTGTTNDTCPTWKGNCSDSAACGTGYTCVRSISHPIPASVGVCRKWTPVRDTTTESCADTGMLSGGQLWDNRATLTNEIVKVTGTLGYSVKCSKNVCMDDPCCNTCKGHYVLDVVDPDTPDLDLTLRIRTEAAACSGTTCDVTCGPYRPGDTYVMWGVLDQCQSATNCSLLLMGGCLY